MTKRQLTDDEKKFVRKNLAYLEEDLEYIEKVDLPKVQLTLDTAKLVVQKQIREHETNKKRILGNVEEHKNSINVLKKQLRDGVEVKEQKTDSTK